MDKKKRNEMIGISATALLFVGCLIVLTVKKPQDFHTDNIPKPTATMIEEGGEEYYIVPVGECADLCLNPDGTVIITGTGKMWEFESREAVQAHIEASLLEQGHPEEISEQIVSAKKIVIEEGMTELGDYSLSIYQKAEVIELPDTLRKVNDHAFLFFGAEAEVSTAWEGLSLSDIKYTGTSFLQANGITEGEDGMVEEVYTVVNQVIDKNAEPYLLYQILVGNTMYCLYDTNVLEIAGVGMDNSTKDFFGESELLKLIMRELEVTTPKEVDELWFSRVKHIIIRDGVERIGDYALARCRNVNTITILGTPGSFGKYAFCRLGFTAEKKLNWNGFNCSDTAYEETTFSLTDTLPDGAVKGKNYSPKEPQIAEVEG